MLIGIDARCFSEAKRSGVEEYTENLLEYLFQLDQKNCYILFYNSFRRQLPQPLLKLAQYPNVFLRRYSFPNKIINLLLWYFRFPALDKLLGVSVFFSPNLMFTSVSRRSKHLLTIHDLSFERHPEFFNFYRRLWHWLINPRQLALKAQKIITVSDSTRDDLVELYGCLPQRIKRIYPGIPESMRPSTSTDPAFRAVKAKYQLPQRYILTLSTLEPRKNIDSVIRAFNYLKKTKKIKHKLVIAGKQGWLFEKTQKLIDASRREDIILLGEVEAEERRHIYSAADLFVYPSFYEGFGFPPLEALACGTTVIASCLSSLPEALGDAALLIDPYNRNALVWAMERGIQDQKLKARLRENGFRRAALFNWKKSAVAFLEIIQNLAEKK